MIIELIMKAVNKSKVKGDNNIVIQNQKTKKWSEENG